jgi:hypothetical protein
MSLLLAGKGSHPNPSASAPIVEGNEHAVSPQATFTEQVSTLLKSDVGELGFLFGHEPGRTVSTAIPAPATNAVTPAQSAAMASGMQVAAGPQAPDTSMDAEYGNGTAVPVNAPPTAQVSGTQNGWRFRDTLASEVGKIKERVAKYQAAAQSYQGR